MLELTRKFKPMFRSYTTVIDIETTGLDVNKNGIINISFVTINPQSWTKPVFEFTSDDIMYGVLFTDPNELGRVSNPRTMKFHDDLPEHVKKLNFPSDKVQPWHVTADVISLLLAELDDKAERVGLPHYLMGNGPDFDQAFIASYFKQLGKVQPWKHWQNVDFRTLVAVLPIPEDIWDGLKAKSSELLFEFMPEIDKSKDYSHFAGYDTILEALGAVWIVQQLNGDLL